MQALNRFVLMLGGGYAGSAIYNNKDNLPIFLGSSVSDFAKNLKVVGASGNSGVEKQIESLTQDMRALMLSNRNGTIVLSGSQGTGLTKVVLILVPGAGIYLWYKGVRLSDLQWVSRKSFEHAVTALSTAQDALSKTVTDFRQSVQKKIADFQAHVESRFRSVQEQIDTQVGEVRDGVRSAQSTLDGIDTRVQRLEGRLEDSVTQLQYANKGIHLLCSVVAESIGGNSNSHRALQNFAQSNPTIGLGGESPLGGRGFPMLDNEAPVLVEYVQQLTPSTFTAPRGVIGGTFPRPVLGDAFKNVATTVKTPSSDSERDTSNPPCPEAVNTI